MTPASHPFAISAAAGAPLRFRDRVRARVGSAEVLVFRVGNERFAVDLQAVDETVEAPELHTVPESSPTMRGVFLHASQFLPLYDTARVLEVPDGEGVCRAALVMRGGGRRIGLAVADVEDVVLVDFSTLREVPEGAWTDEMLLGLLVKERQVIAVLDARTLVTACQTPPVPETL